MGFRSLVGNGARDDDLVGDLLETAISIAYPRINPNLLPPSNQRHCWRRWGRRRRQTAGDLKEEVDESATNTRWWKPCSPKSGSQFFRGDLGSIGEHFVGDSWFWGHSRRNRAVLVRFSLYSPCDSNAIFAWSSIVFGDLWLQLQRFPRHLLVGDLSVTISAGTTSSVTLPKLWWRLERTDGGHFGNFSLNWNLNML